MSAVSNARSSENKLKNRFSFQYFDCESDFGIENEQGERVRKRKKPGRKPNPPSIQERRAQNRAAQKAFREREQQKREEREKQWKFYSEEVKKLRKQLAITQYEAKYLKACVLHLTLAFLVLRGSVPQIWSESRIIPSNSHGEYKKPFCKPYGREIVNEAYQTPALLDMMLEKQHIMEFNKAAQLSVEHTPFIQCRKRKIDDADHIISAYQAYIEDEIITLNKATQDPNRTFPRAKRLKSNSTNYDNISPSTIIPTSTLTTSPSDLPPLSFDTPYTPQGHESSTSIISSSEESAYIQRFEDNTYQRQTADTPSTFQSNNMFNSNSQALTIHQKPVVDICLESPPFRNPEDLMAMPAIQALHVVRLQLKLSSILGGITPVFLLPTALQRVIPHDIRIDYVPAGSVRDRLILFQDYYDMDECFQYLTQTIVFTGGDVRNPKNWTLDPSFNVKFWFLSHQMYDYAFAEYLPRDQLFNISETLLRTPTEDEGSSSNTTSYSAEGTRISANSKSKEANKTKQNKQNNESNAWKNRTACNTTIS